MSDRAERALQVFPVPRDAWDGKAPDTGSDPRYPRNQRSPHESNGVAQSCRHPGDRDSRVFAALDPEKFLNAFMRWTQSLRETLSGEVVAIDGKALRRAIEKGESPKVVVSAWAAGNGLVLGQRQVAGRQADLLEKLAETEQSAKRGDGLERGTDLDWLLSRKPGRERCSGVSGRYRRPLSCCGETNGPARKRGSSDSTSPRVCPGRSRKAGPFHRAPRRCPETHR